MSFNCPFFIVFQIPNIDNKQQQRPPFEGACVGVGDIDTYILKRSRRLEVVEIVWQRTISSRNNNNNNIHMKS